VSLRNAYHAAVQIPIDNMEELWSELVTYEYSLDAATVDSAICLIPWLTFIDSTQTTGTQNSGDSVAITYAGQGSARSAPAMLSLRSVSSSVPSTFLTTIHQRRKSFSWRMEKISEMGGEQSA
jgi:hypothetical protein